MSKMIKASEFKAKCLALMDEVERTGEPVVITNSEGGRLTPSVVGFAKSGERLVGQVAKRQAVTNPENTVFSIKRFMGRRLDEVSEEMKMVPYRVVADGDRVAVKIDGQPKPFTPPEVSAAQCVRGPPGSEKHESRTPGSSAVGVGVCPRDAPENTIASTPATRVFMPISFTSVDVRNQHSRRGRSAVAAAPKKGKSAARGSRAPAA